MSTPNAPAADAPQRLVRTQIGVVTSDKRDKTRTVEVGFQHRHPKYGKILHRTTRHQVHDPGNVSKKGDQVQIVVCRPISKTKMWRLVKVVQAAPKAIDEHA